MLSLTHSLYCPLKYEQKKLTKSLSIDTFQRDMVNSTTPAYLTLIHPFEVNTSILSRGFSPDDLACKGCSHPGQGNVISCLFEDLGAV